MLDPIRIRSFNKPRPFIDLGNGYWYYNFDIKSEIVTIYPTREGESPKEETKYNYIQIKMAGKPDYKRCVEAIIRQYITQSQEFDLINSYNRAAFNMLSEDEAEKVGTDYIDYLNKVSEIKTLIKKDFE